MKYACQSAGFLRCFLCLQDCTTVGYSLGSNVLSFFLLFCRFCKCWQEKSCCDLLNILGFVWFLHINMLQLWCFVLSNHVGPYDNTAYLNTHFEHSRISFYSASFQPITATPFRPLPLSPHSNHTLSSNTASAPPANSAPASSHPPTPQPPAP